MNSETIKKWTTRTESEHMHTSISKFSVLKSQNLEMKCK